MNTPTVGQHSSAETVPSFIHFPGTYTRLAPAGPGTMQVPAILELTRPYRPWQVSTSPGRQRSEAVIITCSGHGVRTVKAWEGPRVSLPVIFQTSLTTWHAAGLYGTCTQRKKGSLWVDKLAKAPSWLSKLRGCTAW